jgi:hypothetical protein
VAEWLPNASKPIPQRYKQCSLKELPVSLRKSVAITIAADSAHSELIRACPLEHLACGERGAVLKTTGVETSFDQGTNRQRITSIGNLGNIAADPESLIGLPVSNLFEKRDQIIVLS